MKCFFILGKNPTLSFAELATVLALKPEQVLYLSKEAAVLDLAQDIDARALIKKLGGTIKMGVVHTRSSIINAQSILNEQIFNSARYDGKFNFGISYYGEGKLEDEKHLAMEMKKALKEKGVSSRWVTSREKVLSSVVVEQNKLTSERGAEVVIINNGQQYFIGETMAVQPFKELSARDYGRPGRDDYSGMLPPKLAQILINLGFGNLLNNKKVSETSLLDPFCGSGTILTEAALMGFKNILGYDKSELAISDTQRNLEWIKKTYDLSLQTYDLRQCDVQRLSQKIKPNSIDVIVTEPYLGPARGKRNHLTMERIARELEQLYHQAILQFEKVLKSTGRVVMIWPVFVLAKNESVFLNTKEILKSTSFQKIIPLAGFPRRGMIEITDRNTILYYRPDQRVRREIVILQKSSL